MVLASASTLSITSFPKSTHPPPSKPLCVACHLGTNFKEGSSKIGGRIDSVNAKPSWNWTNVLASTALAAAVVSFSSLGLPAIAERNKFEPETRSEFDLIRVILLCRKAVHTNENFSENEFGEGAEMLLNEANLTNAVFVRSVLTLSDLGGAVINGADFSDAVVDLSQKQALCKYANGTNPITGVSTRKSLGCGNSRRNAYGTPSSPLLSAPPQKLLDRDGYCDPETGLCDAN